MIFNMFFTVALSSRSLDEKPLSFLRHITRTSSVINSIPYCVTKTQFWNYCACDLPSWILRKLPFCQHTIFVLNRRLCKYQWGVRCQLLLDRMWYSGRCRFSFQLFRQLAAVLVVVHILIFGFHNDLGQLLANRATVSCYHPILVCKPQQRQPPVCCGFGSVRRNEGGKDGRQTFK